MIIVKNRSFRNTFDCVCSNCLLYIVTDGGHIIC